MRDGGVASLSENETYFPPSRLLLVWNGKLFLQLVKSRSSNAGFLGAELILPNGVSGFAAPYDPGIQLHRYLKR